MSIRRDLRDALESWTSDGGEAFEVSEQMFANIVAVIRKQFPGMTLSEAELLLADVRRDTEDSLFGLLCNTITIGAAIDIVASRFFGED
jgi:hypothetical protein